MFLANTHSLDHTSCTELKEANQYVDYMAWFIQFAQGRLNMPITVLPDPSPTHPCIILNLVRYQTHNSTVVEVTDPVAAKKLHGRVEWSAAAAARKKARLEESTSRSATAETNPAPSNPPNDSQNSRANSTTRSSLADLLAPADAPSSVRHESEDAPRTPTIRVLSSSSRSKGKGVGVESLTHPAESSVTAETTPVERAPRPTDISRLVDPPDSNDNTNRALQTGGRASNSRHGASSAPADDLERGRSRKRPRIEDEFDEHEHNSESDDIEEIPRPDSTKDRLVRTNGNERRGRMDEPFIMWNAPGK
jgi:hypothetical protein